MTKTDKKEFEEVKKSVHEVFSRYFWREDILDALSDLGFTDKYENESTGRDGVCYFYKEYPLLLYIWWAERWYGLYNLEEEIDF